MAYSPGVNCDVLTPWFIQQLTPAAGERLNPYQLGESSARNAARLWTDVVPPLVAVASRQYVATRSALAGDGEGVITSSAQPSDAIAWMAHLLKAMDPKDRRTAMYAALHRAEGPRRAVVPFYACIPRDATQEQASALIDGLGMMLLSLGSAGTRDTASTIYARAASMATRQPFASDPNEVAAPTDVSLAKMLLDAYLADPNLRDEIFKSPAFRQALESVAAEAAAESVTGAAVAAADEAQAISDDELELQRRIYDCIAHEFPLGGDPAGRSLREWIKGAAGKVKKFVSKVEEVANDDEADKSTNGGAPKVGIKKVRVGSSTDGTIATSDTTGASSDEVSANLDAAVADSKQMLDEAMEKMAELRGNLAEQQGKLKSDARDYARLLWASELLSSNDDVADILSSVRPNASDAGAFINTALGVIPAAKASGNLSTLKALGGALRSAMSRNGIGDGSILEMLSGDPEATLDGGAALPGVAASLKQIVRSSWLTDASPTESAAIEPVVDELSQRGDVPELADESPIIPVDMGDEASDEVEISVPSSDVLVEGVGDVMT